MGCSRFPEALWSRRSRRFASPPSIDELERRFEAARKHYGVSKDDVRGRIIIDSVKADVMSFAKEGDEGIQIAEPVVASLRETIERNKIDVVIIDPWVSAHSVDHNDIHKVQPIVTMFKDLAEDTGACIELVVHPRKTAEKDLTEEDMIGSVGLPNKTRDVRVLNKMAPADAAKYGIEPWAVGDYFRVDNVKHTHKRSTKPVWRRKISVSLGNRGPGLLDFATDVGVVTQWTPPTAESLLADLTPEQIVAIKAAVDGGLDRANAQAEKWAGRAVGRALGWDVDTGADKARAKSTLSGLIKGGHLKEVTKDDEKSRPRKHVAVA
jgi:hypothetical protein